MGLKNLHRVGPKLAILAYFGPTRSQSDPKTCIIHQMSGQNCLVSKITPSTTPLGVKTWLEQPLVEKNSLMIYETPGKI